MDCMIASTALTRSKSVKSSVGDDPCFVAFVSMGMVKGISMLLIGAGIERLRPPFPWRRIIAIAEEIRLETKALRGPDAIHPSF